MTLTGVARSVGAVLAGLVLVVAGATLVDMAGVALGLLPSFEDEASWTTEVLIWPTLYRIAFAVAGSWLAARLAPSRPMTHALVLGAIGFVASVAGFIVMRGHGPDWYPIALIVTALPCAWLGGRLARPKAVAA